MEDKEGHSFCSGERDFFFSYYTEENLFQEYGD